MKVYIKSDNIELIKMTGLSSSFSKKILTGHLIGIRNLSIMILGSISIKTILDYNRRAMDAGKGGSAEKIF